MPTSELCIVTPRRLSRHEWQNAIDAGGFFVELKLSEEQPEVASGRWEGRLGGKPVRFILVERPLVDVFGSRSGRDTWRHAFSTPASGDIASCAAGGMALLAYAAATHGTFYDATTGPIGIVDRVKEAVDVMAAVALGKAAEYEALHPSAPPSGRDGLSVTATRVG